MFLRGINIGQVMISQDTKVHRLIMFACPDNSNLSRLRFFKRPVMLAPFHIFSLLQSKGQLPASLSVLLPTADGFVPQFIIFFLIRGEINEDAVARQLIITRAQRISPLLLAANFCTLQKSPEELCMQAFITISQSTPTIHSLLPFL